MGFGQPVCPGVGGIRGDAESPQAKECTVRRELEITFKSDTTYRKGFFVAESFAHPAKMMAPLLLWIVEKYTQPADTILDPMAGLGTMMLACPLGRDVVMVELEEKFIQMQRDNWEKVRQMPQLGYEMGTCTILQGDARNLEGLFDGVITSPPYADTLKRDRSTDDSHRDERETTHAGGSVKIMKGYQGSRGNIGNLKYGEIDAVVTSPPYEDSLSEPVDRKHSIDQTKWADGRKIAPPNSQVHQTYPSSSENNIGNLKSASYLEAMLQVYRQCHKVLRDSGLMILVTKDFIRDQKRVDLAGDTIKLCQQAGFSFIERHYRKITQVSFWRTIYQQKYPDAPVIDREDILVFRK